MIKKWLRFLDLKSDADNVDEIHQTIKNGIIFKGTNLWILVFAIIIASVGLNTNSTAVIIGAMLISPLMGPINGMGYSIATYDFALFRRALKNFGFAVVASLFASTVYFSISPLSTAHSELLARTSPSIYDVLIALFGGLAGIVAISSKHKGNVIPGVAIATALMPPLCTAGYGLATAQFYYFFGAFYLFTINTVFIGISSVLFSQILNLPIRTIVEPEQRRRVNRWITVVITITIIPSLYFGYLLVEKERFTEKANMLVSSSSVVSGSYLLKYDINAAKESITLTYGGNVLNESDKKGIFSKAKELELDGQIIFEQGFSFNDVSEDINKVDNTLRAEINRLSLELIESEKRNDSVSMATHLSRQLFLEAKSLYPQINSLAYSSSFEFSQVKNDSIQKVDSIKVNYINIGVGQKYFSRKEQEKIESWIKTRLASDHLRVSYRISEAEQ
jgi:uncharacterized hydrophobic protein (TIGR00271 family)